MNAMTTNTVKHTPADAAPIELAGMFLEWQRIEDAKAELAEQSKDLFKAAKDKGYDTKAMRAVFREKRVELEASPEDAAKAEEAEAMNDLYRSALDRGLTARARPAHDAREEDISYAQLKIQDAQALASENEREPVDWDEISCRELPDDSPVKVYFIAAPSLGLIKIGSTGAVERRISAIQRGVPVPTALIGVIAGGAKREVELHKKYAAHRVHGEWFSEVIRPELELLLTDQTVIEEFPSENLSYSQSGLTYADEKGRGDHHVQPVGTLEASAKSAQDDVGATASSTNPVANVGEEANGAIAAASYDPASRDDDGADLRQPASSGFTGEDDGRDVEAAGGAAPVVTNSNSTAAPRQSDSAGEAPSSNPASPATHSDDIDLTIPDFLRRTEGGYPKREAVEAH